jgi:hypothetical protein
MRVLHTNPTLGTSFQLSRPATWEAPGIGVRDPPKLAFEHAGLKYPLHMGEYFPRFQGRENVEAGSKYERGGERALRGKIVKEQKPHHLK